MPSQFLRRLDRDRALAEDLRQHLHARIRELESEKTSGAWPGARTSHQAAATVTADRTRRRELDTIHTTLARLDKTFPPWLH